MATTTIEWTDASWNPVTGCDRVSAGCDHCYAATLAKRLKAMGNPRYQHDGDPPTSGPGFGVTLHPDKLADPLAWRKPRRVFVNSMSDLFHAWVPQDFIDKIFGVMAARPHHTFQVLTKRPQRMFRYLDDEQTKYRIWHAGRPIVEKALGREMYDVVPVAKPGQGPDWCYPAVWPLPNVWLGTSVEDQDAAYRIDWLVKTPAAVRFLSCEPLIGPIDLSPWFQRIPVDRPSAFGGQTDYLGKPRIHWVIAGGESGPGFRPLDLDWARSLRHQCVDAGVPFFFKQIGGIRPKAGGRELDGRTWDQFPEVRR